MTSRSCSPTPPDKYPSFPHIKRPPSIKYVYFFPPKYNSKKNRQTYLTKEMNESYHFLFVDLDINQLKYQLKHLNSYDSDKIKFVTRVEVDSNRLEGTRSSVKIAKQPIYSKDDQIVFLLVFQWFPNHVKTMTKIRKGSFSSEKEISSVKIRFQKAKIEEQDLLSVIYLLSQKVYIEEKHVDEFTKIISKSHQISIQHQNCLTAILSDSNHKRNFTNLTSTIDQSRYHYYYYDNPTASAHDLDRMEKTLSFINKNDSFMNRFSAGPNHKISSQHIQKSPKNSERRSMDAKDMILDDSERRTNFMFNQDKIKKYFSALEYIVTDGVVSTQMIVFHISQSEHLSNSGFKLQTLDEFLQEWPKYKQFTDLHNLNKQKIINQIIKQTSNNYNVMLQMQLQQIHNVKLQEIYQNIQQFNNKTINQFLQSTKQYVNQPDYNKYITKLEEQLTKLQKELVNTYAQTKFQYGSRMLKNIQKKHYKQSKENYLLMKVLGKEQINHIQVSYKIYKQFLQQNLEEGFKQFLTKRFYFNTNKHSANYQEQELNYVQNRIQICQQKKKMLDSAIDLQLKQTESLRMMLKILQRQENRQSNPSERMTQS